MKQIITQPPPPTTIAIGDISRNPIIGFVDISKRKGWCQPTTYLGSIYKQYAVDKGISVGNSYNIGDLKKLFEMSSFTYFLFDTEKELFKWLSE